MNKTPSILVDTGFEVDQNGVLTEITIPKVVTTLQTPTKVTYLGETLNYIPSTNTALQELHCPNVTNLIYTPSTFTVCSGYTQLRTVNMPNLKTISYSAAAPNNGAFANCSSLTTITMPKLTTITDYGSGSGNCYTFLNCTALTTVELPCITNIIGQGVACGPFKACTGLINVTLGSAGHPVASLSSYTFTGCTQSGLTITIYTSGGASLSGSPWGATNATIVWEEA